MKKVLSCLLVVILCAVTVSCVSTFGMEGDGDVGGSETSVVSLNIGDYVLLGKYYDEPILWRCVDRDENGPLMLSDKILCTKEFDNLSIKNVGSHARSRYGREEGSNYWGDSNIRSWLNSVAEAGNVRWLCGEPPWSKGYKDEKGFLADGNFTQPERDVIKEVTLKSLLDPADAELAVTGTPEAWDEYLKGNDSYDEICAEYLTERMFLLDLMQLTNVYQNREILGGQYHLAKLTQKAADTQLGKKMPIYVSEEGYSKYWLRTPKKSEGGRDGENRSSKVYLVSSQGARIELSYAGAAYDYYGVRPAFYLDEGAAEILSGSGTEEDPYVINGKKNDKISVYCDGWELNFDVQPVNEDGRVLVPMRKIFEALGAEVSWDENTRTATAVRGDTRITLQIDSDVMYKNDAEVQLEVPARIVGDRTLIPIRAISEALGAKVEWLEESKQVVITT